MPVTLGLNISSLKAQSQLGRSSSQLSAVFERLSSGQRINRASDDAAGLAIAESLNSDARVFTQGIRNLNDGLSVLNVADGALNELTNITVRLAELAEQSANGVLGREQRAALDEEAQALSDEYFRIVQSTEFNGRQLFTADYGELRLQAGFGLEGSIAEGLGGAIGTGEFTSGSSQQVGADPVSLETGDFNGDGFLDLITTDDSDNTISILLGVGDGSFAARKTIATAGSADEVAVGDLNQDGILDVVVANTAGSTVQIFTGTGDGNFRDDGTISVVDRPGEIFIEDFNGDGQLDILTDNNLDNSVSLLTGNGDGTFNSAEATTLQASFFGNYIEVGDFNNDGIKDFVGFSSAHPVIGFMDVYLGQGDGTFERDASARQTFLGIGYTNVVGDFNGDGDIDIIMRTFVSGAHASPQFFEGNGDGTFESAQTVEGLDVGLGGVAGSSGFQFLSEDFNGDGILDIVTLEGNLPSDPVTVFLGNGDATFDTGTEIVTPGDASAYSAGDFDGDGVLDLAIADDGLDDVRAYTAETADGVSPLLEFSLTTIADAKQALSQFTQKIDQLSEQRGQIGAFQARVGVAENVLQVTTENYRAAESRIRDADIAQEAADLVRLQILQQSGASVLGQANLQPQLVLQLLGGG